MTIRIGIYLVLIAAYPILSILTVRMYHNLWHDLIWFRLETLPFAALWALLWFFVYRISLVLRPRKPKLGLEEKIFFARDPNSYTLFTLGLFIMQSLLMFFSWSSGIHDYSKYLVNFLGTDKPLTIFVATEGKFMEGHLEVRDSSASLNVTYARPNNVIKEGDNIKSITDIRPRDWGASIKSSKFAPGSNPIKYEQVRLKFTLECPLRHIDVPIELRGHFIIRADYPVRKSSGSFEFTNVSSTVKTEEISCLLLPMSEQAYYITQEARETNFSVIRASIVLVSLFFFVAILVPPRVNKRKGGRD